MLQPAINNLALDDTKKDYVGDIFQNASTNVARFVQTDDGVRITTAAEYARDKSSNDRLFYGWSDTSSNNVDYTTRYTQKEWEDLFATDGKAGVGYNPLKVDKYAVYRYNYIELDCWDKGIEADQIHYPIAGLRALAGTDNVDHAADEQYRDARSSYVNAVHDTEYYIVNRGDEKVSYFTDYENVKKIDPEYIEAVYAVAENTEYDNNEYDYWVANVIVIEVKGQIGDVDNISLAFSNYKQTTQRVKFLDTLTTKYEGVNAHVIPDGADWGPRWEDYGFYKLYDTEKDGDELLADDIVRIKNGEYNTNGIYAGVVTRVDKVSGRGGYIDVDLHDANNSSITREAVTVKDGAAYLPSSMQYIYAIDGDEAVDDLTVTSKNNGDVRTGDHIIWVTKTDDAKTTYYIVVVSDKNDNDGHNHDWTTKSWLKALYADIISEQRGTKTETVTPSVDVIVSNAIGGPKKITAENVVVKPTAEGGNWKISIANLNTAIGSIAGMSGYTADSFEITSDAKYHGEAVKSATHYEIPGVTGPVVVEVTAKKSSSDSLTIAGNDTAGTEATLTKVEIDGTDAGTPSGGSGDSLTEANLAHGSKIYAEFTTAGKSETRKGYYTIDGVVYEATEKSYDATANKTTWSLTEYYRGENITVSSSTAAYYSFILDTKDAITTTAAMRTGGTALNSAAVTLTTSAAGKTIVVDSITMGDTTFATPTDYTVSSGTITFTANAGNMTGDVTIKAHLEAIPLKITVKGNGYVKSAEGMTSATVGNNFEKEVDYSADGSVTIALTPNTEGEVLYVTKPGESTPITQYTVPDGETVKIENNVLTITGLKTAVTVSITAVTEAEKVAEMVAALDALDADANLVYKSSDPTLLGAQKIISEAFAGVSKYGAILVASDNSTAWSGLSIDKDSETDDVDLKVKVKVGSTTSEEVTISVSVTDTEWEAVNAAAEALANVTAAAKVVAVGTGGSQLALNSTSVQDAVAASIKASDSKFANVTVTAESDSTTNSTLGDGSGNLAVDNTTGVENTAYNVTVKIGGKAADAVKVTGITIKHGTPAST